MKAGEQSENKTVIRKQMRELKENKTVAEDL